MSSRDIEDTRTRLAALSGARLTRVIRAAGLSRATGYRLRKSLSATTPAGTVARLKAALDAHEPST